MTSRLDVTLVALSAEHLPAIAGLEETCFSEPWSAKALGLLLDEGAFGVAAVINGEAVAYGGMTHVLDEGTVTNIAVHPDYRRRGLGRAVTEGLLAGARQRGLRTVFLEVRESNEAAIELYRSMGFRACGLRKNFYRKPVESAFQMVWEDNGSERRTT